MGLLTGTPVGNVISQDEIYIEGAPYIYYQDAAATELWNPDGDGYYWGLFGTSTYPVYGLACYEDVQLGTDLTVNAVRCDNVGDKAVIQKLNHLEFQFSLSTLFPLTTSAHIIRGSTPTSRSDWEKTGIAPISNNAYYHICLRSCGPPRVTQRRSPCTSIESLVAAARRRRSVRRATAPVPSRPQRVRVER